MQFILLQHYFIAHEWLKHTFRGVIITIITDKCYLGGTVALLLQDHLTTLI